MDSDNSKSVKVISFSLVQKHPVCEFVLPINLAIFGMHVQMRAAILGC